MEPSVLYFALRAHLRCKRFIKKRKIYSKEKMERDFEEKRRKEQICGIDREWYNLERNDFLSAGSMPFYCSAAYMHGGLTIYMYVHGYRPV